MDQMDQMDQNFDSLFIAAESKAGQEMGDLQRAVVARALPSINQPSSQGSSRQGSRCGSGHGSRGSPARKATPTCNTLCPSNPTVMEMKAGGINPSRSHSMREQTSHMREKYKRRPSIKNSSPIPLSSRGNSRNNSLPMEELEVTRQFLATNKKVGKRMEE